MALVRLIGFGAVSALVGCSAADSAAEHPPAGASPSATATAPAATAPKAVKADVSYMARLPIAAYAYSQAQSATIDAAEDVLTDRCMRRYGLTFQAPEKLAVPADASADRRYGLSSAEDAARYGYHLAPDEEAQAPAPPARSGTPQYLVLFGRQAGQDPADTAAVSYQGRSVPRNGCRGEAVTTMDSGFADPAGAGAASTIASGSYTASMRDPQVRGALRKWSACMKGKGYDYATPLASLGDKDFLGKEPAPREVATAEADMSCKTATNLLDTWFSAESRIQSGMIARQVSVLDKLRSEHAAKAAAAARIVSTG